MPQVKEDGALTWPGGGAGAACVHAEEHTCNLQVVEKTA
jgi:hypothetical protein